MNEVMKILRAIGLWILDLGKTLSGDEQATIATGVALMIGGMVIAPEFTALPRGVVAFSAVANGGLLVGIILGRTIFK